MIAADTSSLVAYFAGETGSDVGKIAAALSSADLVLPPAVLTEILTDPAAGPVIENKLQHVPVLDTTDGYWLRAGQTRRLLYRNRLKAKVADVLIAQSCIDHRVALITRDTDFRHFAKLAGLVLA